MDLAPQSNVDFLKRCARWIPVINFVDYETGQVYARLQRGKWSWRDEHSFAKALDNPQANAGLLAVAHNVSAPAIGIEEIHADVATEKMHSLGAWGRHRLIKRADGKAGTASSGTNRNLVQASVQEPPRRPNSRLLVSAPAIGIEEIHADVSTEKMHSLSAWGGTD
jgi:hypothetical protein